MALPQQVPAHANATESEVNIMSKGMDSKKQAKKKPLKTASEKRMAKKDKHGAKTLLGSPATSA
jgi:hypothetical protein